jgi:beta-carotene ketolase (CrtW type)
MKNAAPVHRPITPAEATDFRYRGLAVAGLVIGLWAAVLGFALFALPLTWGTVPLALLLFLILTHLYTGLFITAHDAMHGTVAPRHPRLNHAVGRLATTLYALFSYRSLEREHHNHHDHPASEHDPDFTGDGRVPFWRWYVAFLRHYMTLRQLGMMAAVAVGLYLVGVPPLNLTLFWGLAPILSSLQLFYFGTYLTHRRPAAGYADRHRATTNDFGTLASFLTCYHFGYHWEHHEYPYVPWWKLPAARARVASSADMAPLP